MELTLSCQERQYPSEEKTNKQAKLFPVLLGFRLLSPTLRPKISQILPGLWLSSGELCDYLDQNPDTSLSKQLFDLGNLKGIWKQKHGKHSVNMKVRQIRFLSKIWTRFHNSINISYLCALKETVFGYKAKRSKMGSDSNQVKMFQCMR